MNIKDAFKNIADSLGWGFEYARRDYQNLTDVSDWIHSASQNYATGETFLFLDPVIRSPHETGITYSGNMMILTNSDIDMTYNDKFEGYIRPILDIVLGSFKNKLICDFDVNLWRVIEVVNFFDFNADGVSISFEIKGY